MFIINSSLPSVPDFIESNDDTSMEIGSTNSSDSLTSSSEDDNVEDRLFGEKMEALNAINICLSALKISPIVSVCGTNLEEKCDDVTSKLTEMFQKITNKQIRSKTPCKDCEDLIQRGIEKFQDADRNTKFMILTSIPKKISKKETKELFGCSDWVVRKANELRSKDGPFSTPVYDKSYHFQISNETKHTVKAFYKRSEFSRALPFKRETLRIKEPGSLSYEIKGKYRMMVTIPELFEEFKLSYPDIKISLSSFHLLRPKECIPVGRGVYHNTCACVIHENFDLMLGALGNDINLTYILHTIPCD